MNRLLTSISALCLASACTDDGVRSPGDELGSESGESLGSESDAGSDGGSSSDAGTTGVTSDLPGDDTGDTGVAGCEPASSWDPWIGGPCMEDLDCGYDGGICLREDEGWPCGTCSLPCDLYCPDVADAPETFCVDHQSGAEPFAPDQGACLSKCDPNKFPGGGCRPGYSCVLVDRFSDPDSKAAVCLPQEIAPPLSECQQALTDAGLSWIPAYVPLDHPDGLPNLDCVVAEPVRLYSPINGIDYRYIESENPAPILVSCGLAQALDQFGYLLQSKGAVEVAHIGTYNCRVISGTETLSEHAFGRAIDLGGFTLEGGEYFTVLDDWEDGVADPVTFAGQWLKDLTDKRFEQMIFNIILTPEYNAAHDNHFHVDLTPDAHFYE
ncbi:MAG: extensin family protein [Myxococcales bacterium]|nr:extensin family protein [Myxococcales bacterium]